MVYHVRRGRTCMTTDERSTIEAPPAAEPTRRAQRTPDGAGERVDLAITGMTCAACARRIERTLAKASGVRSAAVNFATSRATVEYDPSATRVRDLVDA